MRPGTQVRGVAEHLRHGHLGLDHLAVAALGHAFDLAPPTVEVADDVTHVVLGGGHLDVHHRLEELHPGLLGSLLERHGTGDLEGHLR